MSEDRIRRIIELAELALTLAGEERIAKVAEVVSTGVEAYQEMSGKPFDIDALPDFKPID